MNHYSLTHLGNRELLRNCDALVARDCATTAELLAHIAEIDARKAHVPEGFRTMLDYCLEHLHLSKDAALKRIQAARAARQFPAIFEAVGGGRVHLTGVGLLVPYLTPENAGALLTAATHRSKEEIQRLLAERFPGSEMLALVQALPAGPAANAGVAVPDRTGGPPQGANVTDRSRSYAPAHMDSPGPRAQVTPLAPQRFTLQVTIAQRTYQNLEYARALLAHQLPGGEIAEVLDRALAAYVGQLEKRRFAATRRPRSGRPCASTNPRHIPAEVKHSVWEREAPLEERLRFAIRQLAPPHRTVVAAR